MVPWAKQQKSIAEDKTVNASEFSFITEGRFEIFKDGDIVFYASESISTDSVEEQNMEEIFIYALNEDTPIIVLANEAIKYTDSITKGTYLQLKDGVRYEGLPGDKNANVLDFDSYDLEIISGEVAKSSSVGLNIQEKNILGLICFDIANNINISSIDVLQCSHTCLDSNSLSSVDTDSLNSITRLNEINKIFISAHEDCLWRLSFWYILGSFLHFNVLFVTEHA